MTISTQDATDRMLSWPSLSNRSVVLDIGAFDGTWAAQIAAKYRPEWMYLVEPQSTGAHLSRLRTAMADIGYHSYQVMHYGLGVEDATLPMVEADTDGASFIKAAGDKGREQTTVGRLMDAHDWFIQFQEAGGWSDIDLTSMNIEGYEYELLPYLVKTGDIGLLQDLAVQFHLFADPDGSRYESIKRLLAPTHELLWEAFPTWVAWRRRNP